METKEYISPKIEVFILDFEGQICVLTDSRFNSTPDLVEGESGADPD